jgi:hypothetical protein
VYLARHLPCVLLLFGLAEQPDRVHRGHWEYLSMTYWQGPSLPTGLGKTIRRVRWVLIVLAVLVIVGLALISWAAC